MNDAHDTNPRLTRSAVSRRAGWMAVAAAATLLITTPVLAHGGTWGAGDVATPSGMPGYGMHGGVGMPGVAGMPGGMPGGMGMHRFAPGAGTQPMFAAMLQHLPLGTEVAVTTYAGDPADGADVVASLSAVVGETSEAAFAEQLRAALADAAFVTVEVGERTQRVTLDGTTPHAPFHAYSGMGQGLEIGQTVEFALFASADDVGPTTVIAFTYGEDSEVAFRAELQAALADTAVMEVSLPAVQHTIDLATPPFAGRFGADVNAPSVAPGLGMHGPGMPGYGMSHHGAPGYGMPGYGMPHHGVLGNGTTR